MAGDAASPRAAALAARLEDVSEALIAVFTGIDAGAWAFVPAPGVWSIGKEAAHVAEATLMHQWIVRRTIGEAVPFRRPPIERRELTTPLSPGELANLVRDRAELGAALLRDLSDAQLALVTKPPRARGQLLGETIERVLIGHYEVHRLEIEAKLAAWRARAGVSPHA